ncbi:MAG: ABC transporter permease [Myxococcaceae bacterium]|nr:ABC transporter permease [Myxococcaceae bacterium]
MNGIVPIALNGFREARRNRVTLVIFVFALVMVLTVTVSVEFTVATFDRVMTDVGLGVIGLIMPALALFLSTGLIPREIERRTIFMLVARPVSRSAFVLGRYVGNLMTVGFLLLVMALLFIAQLEFSHLTSAFGGGLHVAHVVALYGQLLEVILLTAVAFAFATVSSQYVSSLVATCLYFIGHMAEDLFQLAERSKALPLKVLGKGLYYVLPNFDRLDFKDRATYFDPTSASELLGATAYTAAYAALMLVVATAIFERRDFK